jgi:beta-glucosidase
MLSDRVRHFMTTNEVVCLGVQAIRANSMRGTQVGLAENPKVYVPVIESAEHIEAAKRAFREENAPFLTAVMGGQVY